MNSFINRTISGVLMLIVSFICICCGGYALIGYAMTIAVLCLIELFRTFKLNDILVIVLSMLFSVAILYSIGSSIKESLKSVSTDFVKYLSIKCDKMSTIPAAINLSGIV